MKILGEFFAELMTKPVSNTLALSTNQTNTRATGVIDYPP